jgi:hypothetical protein
MFVLVFVGPRTTPPVKWALGRSFHVDMSQTPLGIGFDTAGGSLRWNYTTPKFHDSLRAVL